MTTKKHDDEEVIIPIRRGFIQQFAEDNYGRKLTEEELEEISWAIFEDDDASNHIYGAVSSAIDYILESDK